MNNTFEGGSNGTAMTTGNTGGASGNAFDAVTATVPNFSSTQAMHGSLSASLQAAGNVAWTTSITGTNLTMWGRFYVFLTATPTVVTHVPTFTSPAGTSGFIQFSTARTVNLSAKGGTLGVSATALTINTWYRLEFKHVLVTSGTCTMDCNLYIGDSLTLTEAVPQATGTGVGTDTTINGVKWGSTNATPANTVFFDDIQVNARGLPGPSPTTRRSSVVIPQAVSSSAVM